MVIITRSGNLRKDESPVKSKICGYTRTEGIRDSPSNSRNTSATGKGNGGKRTNVSCSSADSSTSRKSSDTPLVNDTSPSPNARRSRRLASCELLVSADKRAPEGSEDEITLSPLRRSKRIKEHEASSSFGLAVSRKSNSSLNKKIQRSIHEGGRSVIVNLGKEAMNMKYSAKPSKLVAQKKKTMSARAYVAALLDAGRPSNGGPKDGGRGSQENEGSLICVESIVPRSQYSGDTPELEMDNGKEGKIKKHGPNEHHIEELEELCDETEEVIKEHCSSEFDEKPHERSIPNSTKLANMVLEDHDERNLASLNGKDEVHSDELNEGSGLDANQIFSSHLSSSSGMAIRASDGTERWNDCVSRIFPSPDESDGKSGGELGHVESNVPHDCPQSANANIDCCVASVAPMSHGDLSSDMVTTLSSSSSEIKGSSAELFTVCCEQNIQLGLAKPTIEDDPVYMEVDAAIGSFQSVKKTNMEHQSDASVAPDNAEVLSLEIASADVVKQTIELCTVCCKQKSFRENVTNAQDLCSCEGNFISLEGDCARETIPGNEDEVACPREVGSTNMFRDNLVNGRGRSSDSQREINDAVFVNLLEASSKMEEDRRPNATDFLDSTGKTNSLQEASTCNTLPNVGDNCCVICKLPGCLLCCDGKGCKRSYHLYCIDPPLKEVPPGNWYCLYCVRRKIELGSHSVSEGVEAVLDVRSGESSEGTCEGKQYLVKYKGLAHVHNRWLQEEELLFEAPLPLGRFNRNLRGKGILWKEEWTVPQRLLQKRLLMQPELADVCFQACGNTTSSCYYEWFVKWTGLGYEHATWEFENSPFLCTSEAIALKTDFESRQRKQKTLSGLSNVDKLPVLPETYTTILDSDCLNWVNKICEFWHKAQNVVFHEEQERIMKVILFILFVVPNVSRPFLIVTTSSLLSFWESEFRRLAPSINTIVYSGNRDVRTMIRSLEFYGEGGCIKFHVLLSPSYAIVEDHEALDFIGWEAIVADDCQNLAVSKHLEKLKKLSFGFSIILLNNQLKDSIADYLNLLSFLDPGSSQCPSGIMDAKCTSDNAVLALLKNRLSKFNVHTCRVDCLKFLEYWIPVELAPAQLERYCANLFSNSLPLRSFFKTDQVGALRDIVVSQRKCCDHPYLVDEFLQAKLTKDHQAADYLDIGVKASGKLELLDRILKEMKDQGQRVVILFQLVDRDGKSTIGDILDDFLCQRFGVDSYERVESGLPAQKKQIALSKFNNKENGRFVFLIENRACLPSIRLSAVDAVIIFSSDWNPGNDLKALQKITLESLIAYVKVFRLYSAFTVEEKALILAKQDKMLDGNAPNISPSVSQLLLCWGASHLFNKLDDLHKIESSTTCSTPLSDNQIVDDALKEVLVLLHQNDVDGSMINHSTLSRAQLNGATYSKDILLIGEKKLPLDCEESPQILWSKLLDGRQPKWRYISGPSQRARRKVPHPETLFQQPETENDETRKKRKKTGNISVSLKLSDNACMQSSPTLIGITGEPGSPGHNDAVCHNQGITPMHDYATAGTGTQIPIPQSEERENLPNSQRNLHLVLKPELAMLCETLRLSVDVSSVAQLLLEYVINNHRVNREPKTILQAFKICLCWRAASIVKPKLDHRISLLLAKKHLNYECTEQEAKSVYSKLRMLNKRFRKHVQLNYNPQLNNSASGKVIKSGPSLEDPVSAAIVCQELAGEVKWNQGDHCCLKRQPLQRQDQTPGFEVPLPKPLLDIGQLKDEFQSKCIGLIEKISSKRKEKLIQKQQLEEKEFCKFRECEKAKQQKAYQDLMDVISAKGLPSNVEKEKINLLREEFSNIMEKFEEHMKCQRRKLAVMQVEARNKENQILKSWLAEASVGKLKTSFDEIPLTDTGFTADEFMDTEQLGAYNSLSDLSICREYEDACPVGNMQPGSMHEDNVPRTSLPTTSGGTVDDLPGIRTLDLHDTQAVKHNGETECDQVSARSEIQGPSLTAEALFNCNVEGSLSSHQRVEINDPPDREATENSSGPEFIQMSTASGAQRSSLETQEFPGHYEDCSSLSQQAVGTIPTPTDTQDVEIITELECAPMSISEFQGPSPTPKALSICVEDHFLLPHQVPSNPLERPLLPGVFDGAITDGPSQASELQTVSLLGQLHQASQLSDSAPSQSFLSNNAMMNDTGSLLQEVHSGLREDVQDLISSKTDTIAFMQNEYGHGTDEAHPFDVVHMVHDSEKTGANCLITSVDGPDTEQVMNSLVTNTDTASCGSFVPMNSQSTPSPQLLEKSTVMNSSQNHTQESLDTSALVQSYLHCDIAHMGTTGDVRDEVPRDTCCPQNQLQISAQQSSPWPEHSDVACTSGQELNSSDGTSLEITTTAEQTSHTHDVPFPVQLPPAYPLEASSLVGQTVCMQQSTSITHGIVDNPTSTIGDSYNHLLQSRLVISQASLHDPLQNELNKICKEEEIDAEMCEKKKQKLKLELEEELEQIRNKYESLINDVDAKLIERRKTFTTLYNKVSLNRALSEEFRLNFCEKKVVSKDASSKGAGASSPQQAVHPSQPLVAAAHREPASTPSVSLGHAHREPAPTPPSQPLVTASLMEPALTPAVSLGHAQREPAATPPSKPLVAAAHREPALTPSTSLGHAHREPAPTPPPQPLVTAAHREPALTPSTSLGHAHREPAPTPPSQPLATAAHREPALTPSVSLGRAHSGSAPTQLVSLGHDRASALAPRYEQVRPSLARVCPAAAPSAAPVPASSDPPLQVVHRSSALFSTNPAVHHIGPHPLTPRSNYHAGWKRCPAPHLQPFRPNPPIPPSTSHHFQPLRGPINQHAASLPMPPQLVSTPLSLQLTDPTGGNRRQQENLSTRPPVIGSASHSTITSMATTDAIRGEGAGRSMPNPPSSLDPEQRFPTSTQASTVTGRPVQSTETASAAADIICVADD